MTDEKTKSTVGRKTDEEICARAAQETEITEAYIEFIRRFPPERVAKLLAVLRAGKGYLSGDIMAMKELGRAIKSLEDE